METNSFSINATCPLTVRANGGSGGSVADAAAHAGGGGGGQGVIVYAIAQPTVNITTQTNNGLAGTDNSGGTTSGGNGAGTNGSGVISNASSGPLPIELVVFKAEPANNRVRLMWVTASEKNNDYYIVERSHDAINFTTLVRIKGSGSSQTNKTYETFDNEPLSGINYYRLKQIDFDGSFEYSPLISILFEEAIAFVLFPNPLTGDQTLYLKVNKTLYYQNANLFVYDIAGKMILHKIITLENTHEYSLQNLNLEEGIYFLKVQGAYSSQTKKLIIQR